MSVRWITKTPLFDGTGKTVPIRKGEFVDLLPVNLEHPEKKEKGKYQTEEDFRSIQEFLGVPGPYEVSNIGKFPCGGVNLYIKLPHGREPGASSRHFTHAKKP